MHVRQPVQGSRRANARVLGVTAVLKCLNVCAIHGNTFPQLLKVTHGTMAGDHSNNVASQGLELLQRFKIVIERICCFQVEERHEDVRKHVACDEDAGISDQERCMALSMGLVFQNADGGPIPWNFRSPGG